MKINARTAKAADFDVAAHEHAHAFWVYLIIAGIVCFLWGWWAILPGILSIKCAISSIGATKAANQLRKGTYRILNPNNGAPDGDAQNYPK